MGPDDIIAILVALGGVVTAVAALVAGWWNSHSALQQARTAAFQAECAARKLDQSVKRDEVELLRDEVRRLQERVDRTQRQLERELEYKITLLRYVSELQRMMQAAGLNPPPVPEQQEEMNNE